MPPELDPAPLLDELPPLLEDFAPDELLLDELPPLLEDFPPDELLPDELLLVDEPPLDELLLLPPPSWFEFVLGDELHAPATPAAKTIPVRASLRLRIVIYSFDPRGTGDRRLSEQHGAAVVVPSGPLPGSSNLPKAADLPVPVQQARSLATFPTAATAFRARAACAPPGSSSGGTVRHPSTKIVSRDGDVSILPR